MNSDDQVDMDDVDALVAALRDPEAYQSTYGVPGYFRGDVDGDGDLDYDDIESFVALIRGESGTLAGIAEPDGVPARAAFSTRVSGVDGWTPVSDARSRTMTRGVTEVHRETVTLAGQVGRPEWHGSVAATEAASAGAATRVYGRHHDRHRPKRLPPPSEEELAAVWSEDLDWLDHGSDDTSGDDTNR